MTNIEPEQGKAARYRSVSRMLQELLNGENDFVANASNTAALLFEQLERVNWLGFYFLKDGELIVGPFQGKPACVRIAMGKGVCGTAARERKTVVVSNVHDFPGHIACDPNSNSEIVVPLIKNGELLGVLDVDSPEPDRFDEEDRRGLEQLAKIFLNSLVSRTPRGSRGPRGL